MCIRWVLSIDLNEQREEHEQISMGNEFHKRGADAEKALFPHDPNVFGSVRRCLSAECKPVVDIKCVGWMFQEAVSETIPYRSGIPNAGCPACV